MSNDKSRYKNLLGKFINLDEWERVKHESCSGYDATGPSFLIIVTIAYIAIVFFLIIGMPWHESTTEPIPVEDLPYVIPVFIVIYIVVVGGLYLKDRWRKKP